MSEQAWTTVIGFEELLEGVPVPPWLDVATSPEGDTLIREWAYWALVAVVASDWPRSLVELDAAVARGQLDPVALHELCGVDGADAVCRAVRAVVGSSPWPE